MKWKLGIDTGGSYTDAVLVDCSTGNVIKKSKAETTKENLMVGIESAIDQLDIKRADQICLVCLSTTLATNAVIEDKGASVGLITIEAPRAQVYPAAFQFNIKGKINVKGCKISPLDMRGAERSLEAMKGKVEALAVSGYASVRNPAYERRLKVLSDKILAVPVVCAHELTNVLGYYERTITATLNAKLIPVIRELITATRKVLKLKAIDATLVILKGDGTCMVDSFAEVRPIETVLSGPAASALGGMTLAGEDSMVVADLGGTTLDIVSILDRELPIEASGAVVGHWRTKVKAIHTRSFGLGGDSYIRMESTGALSFGPERVIPLCVEAQKNRGLVEEIRTLNLCSDYHIAERQEVDCLTLLKTSNLEKKPLEAEEKEIVELLKEKSHSILYLGEKLNKDIDSINIKRLLALDIVQLASLTPTDILHATGEYVQYNREISELAVKRMARRRKMSEAEFASYTKDAFTSKICNALIKSVLIEKGVEGASLSGEVLSSIFDKSGRRGRIADVEMNIHVPIVGIGAPARTWFRRVAEKLGSRVIIPENSEVANAVGSASGDIKESLEALIRYDFHTKKYIAHLPNRRVVFEKLEESIAFTQKELLLCGRAFAEKLGVKKYKSCIFVNKTERTRLIGITDRFVELRMKVSISADAKNIDR